MRFNDDSGLFFGPPCYAFSDAIATDNSEHSDVSYCIVYCNCEA